MPPRVSPYYLQDASRPLCLQQSLFRRKATQKLADDVAPNALAKVIVLSGSTTSTRCRRKGERRRREGEV